MVLPIPISDKQAKLGQELVKSASGLGGWIADILGDDGRNFLTLHDLRVPTLSIECEACGRRGRYNVARLIERYGDIKLPDLRHVLANCPKIRRNRRASMIVAGCATAKTADLNGPCHELSRAASTIHETVLFTCATEAP